MKTRKEGTKIQGTLWYVSPAGLGHIQSPFQLLLLLAPCLFFFCPSCVAYSYSWILWLCPCFLLLLLTSLVLRCLLAALFLLQFSVDLVIPQKVKKRSSFCRDVSLPLFLSDQQVMSAACPLPKMHKSSLSLLSTMMSNVHFDMYPLEFSLSTFYPLWSLVVCSPGLVVGRA